MKKFLPAIGMIIVIAGGYVISLIVLLNAGEEGFITGQISFFLGMILTFYILKWLLPDFIENEESKKVPIATGKHWLMVLVFVFFLLVYLTGVGIDW